MSGPATDPLREKFDEMEREVRQRDCEHRTPVEITTFGDPERRFICHDCGASLPPEPFEETVYD
jgi:hypothetical protein